MVDGDTKHGRKSTRQNTTCLENRTKKSVCLAKFWSIPGMLSLPIVKLSLLLSAVLSRERLGDWVADLFCAAEPGRELATFQVKSNQI